jgi:hypothetical protein
MILYGFCRLVRCEVGRLRKRNGGKFDNFGLNFATSKDPPCSYTEDKPFPLLPQNFQSRILGALAFFHQSKSCQIRSSYYFI